MLALFWMDLCGLFQWWRYFLILKEFSQPWRYRRTYRSCETDDINFFLKVVGGQSQGFFVGSWLLFSWNERKYLCVDSQNEILVLSEESFLLVSLSLSRDRMTPVFNQGYTYNRASNKNTGARSSLRSWPWCIHWPTYTPRNQSFQAWKPAQDPYNTTLEDET